jgi:hypothetical protein
MRTNFHLARLPRFGFRDGWLYFRNHVGLYRFRGWPQLHAEYLQGPSSWHQIDVTLRDHLSGEFWCNRPKGTDKDELRALVPDGDTFREADSGQICLPGFLDAHERHLVYGYYHWRQFLAAIPEPFVRAATLLACDFFSALELFQQAPVARDLTQHNRMLATALARHWEFPAVGRVDWDTVRQLLRTRRRNIIGWLGYPSTEANVNALERSPIIASNIARAMQRSLALFNDPIFGPALGNLLFIDETGIDCLTNPLTRQWLDSRHLKKAVPRIFECVFSLFEPINRLLAAGIIDAHAARLLSRRKPDRRSIKWIVPYLKPRALPDAPVPTSFGIERLNSLAEQVAEGEEMGHCVGSMDYLLSAVNGDVAIYRVTSPVRATLALTKCKQGYWEIGALRGPHNAEISVKHLAEIARAFPPQVNFDRCIQDRPWAAA